MFSDSYDFYERTLLRFYYRLPDDDDDDDDDDDELSAHFLDDEPEEEPVDAAAEFVSSVYDNLYGYYTSFYNLAPVRDDPSENRTHTVPTHDETFSGQEDALSYELYSVYDYVSGIGHNSQTGGGDNYITIEFNRMSSSESEEEGHRSIIVLLCIGISAFFVIFCVVTAYARCIQLRLRNSELVY